MVKLVRISALLFVLTLAACSGGANSAPPAARSGAAAPASATMSVTIPGKNPQSVRHTAYMTTNVREIDVFAGALSAQVFPVPGPGSYTFTVNVPIGQTSITVNTYDSAHGLISSYVNSSATFSAGGPNQINAATLPVAHTFQLLLAQPTLFAGGAGSTSVSVVNAKDVDGLAVPAGALAYPIVLSVSGGAAHISFTPPQISDVSTTSTLNYDGTNLGAGAGIVDVIGTEGVATSPVTDSVKFATDYRVIAYYKDALSNSKMVVYDAASVTPGAVDFVENCIAPVVAVIDPAGTTGFAATNSRVYQITIAGNVVTTGNFTIPPNPVKQMTSDGLGNYFMSDINGPNFEMQTVTASVAGPLYGLLTQYSSPTLAGTTAAIAADTSGNVYVGMNVAATTVIGGPQAGPGFNPGPGAPAAEATVQLRTVGARLYALTGAPSHTLRIYATPFAAGNVELGDTGAALGGTPSFLAVRPDNRRAVVIDSTNRNVYRIDVTNPAAPSVLQTYNNIAATASRIRGNVAGGVVYAWDPTVGAVTVLDEHLGTTTSFTPPGATGVSQIFTAP